jgi:leucyl aminopeptidase
MSKKLQNIKAVKQMLDGTHKFQTKKTHGFTDAKQKAKQNEKHEVGDIWDEKIGNTIYTIEQMDGFRVKKPKNSVSAEVRKYLESYPNCRKECCKTSFNHLDKKMQTIHGMCYDCVIEMEHKLRVTGKYEEYEQQKIRENKKAWLKQAEEDVKALKEAFTQSHQYVTNADGVLETWEAQMTPEEFNEKVEKEFEKFKTDFIKTIEVKEKND